jgi:hypothetical protein
MNLIVLAASLILCGCRSVPVADDTDSEAAIIYQDLQNISTNKDGTIVFQL